MCFFFKCLPPLGTNPFEGALSHDKAPNLTLWRFWLQMLRWHHGQAPDLEGWGWGWWMEWWAQKKSRNTRCWFQSFFMFTSKIGGRFTFWLRNGRFVLKTIYFKFLPSSELTYPLPRHFWGDDFPVRTFFVIVGQIATKPAGWENPFKVKSKGKCLPKNVLNSSAFGVICLEIYYICLLSYMHIYIYVIIV